MTMEEKTKCQRNQTYSMSGLKKVSLSFTPTWVSLKVESMRCIVRRISEWPKRKAAVANSLRIPGLQLASYSGREKEGELASFLTMDGMTKTLVYWVYVIILP